MTTNRTESPPTSWRPGAPPLDGAPTVTRPSALPTGPRAYHHFLRTPRARWWKGLLAILSLLASYLLLSVLLSFAGVAIDVATGRSSAGDLANGKVTLTPVLFLVNNLALAAMVPLSMLLQWACYGVRPRWLAAVTGAFRWRWLARAAVLVVPIFVVYVTLLYLLIPHSSGQLGALSADAALMLVIVLLTTPLQAAGEEYGFRGLITRAAGSWFASPVVALVVATVLANVLFMIAHLATDPWLIVYYFVFGSALGIIAWRTGGLEVPILVHVTNNLFLLIPAALYGDLSQAFERGPGTGGPIMLLPMGILIAMIFVVEWWARRHQVVRVSTPEAPSALSAVGAVPSSGAAKIEP